MRKISISFSKFILLARFLGAFLCVTVGLKLIMLVLNVFGITFKNQNNILLAVLIFLLLFARNFFAELELEEKNS